jgi:acetyl-CoA carboxylase biotin carboxyl carrier protein
VTIDEIRELIGLANETGVAELELQRGEERVRIRRAGFANPEGGMGSLHVSHPAPPPSTGVASPAAQPAAPSPASPAPPAAAQEPPAKSAGSEPELILVKSPIVGTFYESPSPDLPPFVRIGERIQPGKVLCIIESMKLMNEIEAETTGTVESRLVMNGQPVEYGEALFAIRPV